MPTFVCIFYLRLFHRQYCNKQCKEYAIRFAILHFVNDLTCDINRPCNNNINNNNQNIGMETRSSADADKPARRNVRYIFGSVNSLVPLHFCYYRKAYCMPSTAIRGSASDVTSPTTAAQFNFSVFHIMPSKPHPDCL